ncbi:MAG: sensor histidine kinase [Flavobacteriia bacterium]|jgi:signal transduction histidine kinase
MSDDNIFIMIAVGTILMVVIIIAIIGFVIIYQRKIFHKHQQLSELEMGNQKALVEAVLVTKANEQKRIAQELHDEIGSSINAIKMSLIPLDIRPELKKKLTEELFQISQKVRKISNELMPSVLDELGFNQAIGHLVRKNNESGPIKFDFETEMRQPFELTKMTQLSLYRVIQELINNILKYSNAKNTRLSILHTADFLEINLSDDGDGFIPSVENLSKSDSLGLKNIISRLQSINGTIQFQMNVPKGTIASIHLKRPNG